jgi:predicted amidohydrolase YtcJ
MSRVVLHGGTVITCNAAGEVGEAVCFDEVEGQIIAVGTRAQVQAAAGDGAREVDVEGATVLPGLIDTHPHLMHFGVLAEPLVDLSDAVDHTDRHARRRQRSNVVTDLFEGAHAVAMIELAGLTPAGVDRCGRLAENATRLATHRPA